MRKLAKVSVFLGLAWFLVLVIGVGLLVGCNGEKPGPDPTPVPSVTEIPEPPPPPTAVVAGPAACKYENPVQQGNWQFKDAQGRHTTNAPAVGSDDFDALPTCEN